MRLLTQADCWKAILDGKTLKRRKSEIKVKLNEDGFVRDEEGVKFGLTIPDDWEVYDDTFEMKPAEWGISNDGRVCLAYSNVINNIQEFGMKYHTEELAEKARDEMREANILRYWASVIDPTWKADWDDTKQEKWFIEHGVSAGTYYTNYKYTLPILGTVYMSRKAAIKICEALNNKELSLD